jgi:hypothetical protein
MAKLNNSDRNDASVRLLDAELDAVVGGALEDCLSPQLRLAAHPVGGWTMKDIWTKPTLGTYH